MDWQERMTQAREQHEEADRAMAQADEEYQNVTNQYHQLRAILSLRKERLEGQMSVYAEMLQADDARRLLDEDMEVKPEHLAQDTLDVLQGIVDQYPGDAALATLNGIEKKLQEQDA